MAYEDDFDENGTPKGYPGYNGTKGKATGGGDPFANGRDSSSDVANWWADISPSKQRAAYNKQRQDAADASQQGRDTAAAGRFDPTFDFSGPNQSAANPGQNGMFWSQYAQNGAVGAQGRTFGQPNWQDAQQSRGAQGSLLQDLMNTARGTQMRLNPATGQYESVPVDSLAQMQLQKASDQNLANARSLAASQQGFGHASASRQVLQQSANVGQQQAADSAMLRLQEQQQAQAAAANLAGQMRSGDVNQQQVGSQAAVSMQGLNDSQQRAFAELGQRAAAGDRDAMMAMEQLKASMQANQNQTRLGGAQLQQQTYVNDQQLANAKAQLALAKTEADRAFWTNIITTIMKVGAGAATGGAAGAAGAMGVPAAK